MLTRRTFLAAGAGLIACPYIARAAKPLVLWGPPAAPSAALAAAVAQGALKDLAPGAEFRVWRTPDEMRAGISSGTMEAVVVPTYVAANLFNRGFGTRLVNVMTDGLLYVVAPAGTVSTLADLKGRKLSVPFRNDMPDFILRRLLAANNLSRDELDIDYSGTPPEAIQMLLARRVDAALLSEPACSVVLARGGMTGHSFERAIDTRLAWQAVSGRDALPQAGLTATPKLFERLGEAGIANLQGILEKTVAAIIADPGGAADAAASALDIPKPMVSRSIPFSNLVARPAREARADLESLFTALLEEDARIVGGKLPEEEFYAL